MRASSLVLFAFVLFVVSAFAQKTSMAPTDVGEEQLGEDIVVEGRVYTSGESKSGINLYFGADNSSAFQAIVLAGDLHKFQVDVKKKYSKRNVRVTGKIEEHEGQFYFVRVTEPKQIKVVPRKRGTS